MQTSKLKQKYDMVLFLYVFDDGKHKYRQLMFHNQINAGYIAPSERGSMCILIHIAHMQCIHMHIAFFIVIHVFNVLHIMEHIFVLAPIAYVL